MSFLRRHWRMVIALRLAGWPDDRPVWTGSCPCQPFSAAGAGKAADDERHLWPAWLPLIAEWRPPVVFGEQVEAAIGWGWLDAVFADLEAEGYACGAAVLPACSVGAPHIRPTLVRGRRRWRERQRRRATTRREHGQQPQDGGAVARLRKRHRPSSRGGVHPRLWLRQCLLPNNQSVSRDRHHPKR
jgi:DNA (cytosine-5)-methyltransferase 1